MKRHTALKRRSHSKAADLVRYHGWVASLGCLVCGSPAEVHHISAHSDKPGRITRSHWLVTPLCPMHHRVGAEGGSRVSVEALGHQGFMIAHGFDLHAEAMRLADEWRERIAA